MVGGRSLRLERLVRVGGFAIGVGLVVAALVSWRVAPGDGRLGADLTFFAISSGELSVSPSGAFVVRRGLMPSPRADAVAGQLALRNQTGRPVRVRLRAPADRPSLDRLVQVEATAGRTLLYRGPLLLLRDWTKRSFDLSANEGRDVQLRAWLPRTVGSTYRGRIATLNVEFEATAIGTKT